jgi:hypothetical protein
MRRGLMAWDADEIPVAALNRRVQRLQAQMVAAGEDAIVLYTNFVRSAAVSFVTAFSPYWADGLLLVPQRGEPVFATTLSKRVGSWIQSVKPIGELINSATPGKALGERLAAAGKARRVAILELDDFPSGLYGELTASLPNVEFVDGAKSFAAARSALDAVECRLLGRADDIARDALGQVNSTGEVGTAVGAVETHARLHGAEEVYVATAPDLDADRRFVRRSGHHRLGRRFAIRATVAYKGSWVRRTRTYSRDNEDASTIARADAWFEALLADVDWKRHLEDQIAAAITSVPAELVDWTAEAPIGTRPLAVVASRDRPSKAGSFAPVITLALDIDGLPWCGAGLARLPELSE